jgi:F0F1-type ATP synthase assembly protein I
MGVNCLRRKISEYCFLFMPEQQEQDQIQSDNPHKGDFNIAKGLALSATITGYIIGPLIVLGGIGYVLDRVFATSPWILLGSLLLAFIGTNILIYQRSQKIAEKFTKK